MSGIPENDYAQAIREDTVRPGLLYLGTEHGIYVSLDDGAQPLQLNLPDTQVADIEVRQNDLVIATHGRSFYVLDDIGMLRQLTPAVAASKAHLFAPSPVIRSLRPATIDYYLPEATPKVVIEILDAQGQIVRSFDSGGTGKTKPGTRTGTNRFPWDLRYPGPVTFPGMVLRYAVPGEGPIAMPGTYTVRLTAKGVTETQPLTIRRDPRVTDVTDADLQAQFKLAMEIRDATS